MKQTRKLRALGDVSAIIAQAGSIAQAAKQLGVERSTIYRWIQAGKVTATLAPRAEAVGVQPGQTPDEWAAWVRETYPIDATAEALLGLAVSALQMARTEERASDKLAAMARYQQIVRQLNLQDPLAGRAAAPVRTASIRRPGADPRAILMAVK